MPLLYLQSSIFSFLVYHVIGYRKKVVLDNLTAAFPEKSSSEIRRIHRDFYRHFCDLLVETIKLMSISQRQLKKRVALKNPEVIPDMVAHGAGGIAIFSHYCNWEWLAGGIALRLPFPTFGIYQTLSSKAFDRLMLFIRSRMGNQMIVMEQAYRASLTQLKSPSYIGFLGDQSPAPHGKMYYTPFMGRLAPMHLGIATIALKMGTPIYYFDIRCLRRGHYEVEFLAIPHDDLDPKDKTSVYRLTNRHVRVLEQAIARDPARWLWSHRRWKRTPKAQDTVDDGRFADPPAA